MKYHTLTRASQLIDLSMVDYPERKFRFEVFYLLLSIKFNVRYFVSSFTREGAYFDSITNIYPAAN